MTTSDAISVRAAQNARLLQKLNTFTLCVALVVWVTLLCIAIVVRLAPLAVFSSCIMLAELLVFQIVRTLGDHLDLIRDRE